MNMQAHILAALQEEYTSWENLLAGLGEEQIRAPNLPSTWSIKDVIAHLWAWQRRSVIRVEAAVHGREPDFPKWVPGVDPEDEDNTDQVNAWIFTTYQAQSWSQIHQNWRAGFHRFIELAGQLPERDLLASNRYPWMGGYSLADVLIGSYDHHHEHYEKLLAWLHKQGRPAGGPGGH